MGASEELRTYRDKTGKSATDIAKEMGRPVRTVQNWLNGDYEPNPKNTDEILRYLSIGVDDVEAIDISEIEQGDDCFVLPDNYPPFEAKENWVVALTAEASAEVIASAERTGWTYKQIASEMIMYAAKHRKYKGRNK